MQLDCIDFTMMFTIEFLFVMFAQLTVGDDWRLLIVLSRKIQTGISSSAPPEMLLCQDQSSCPSHEYSHSSAAAQPQLSHSDKDKEHRYKLYFHLCKHGASLRQEQELALPAAMKLTWGPSLLTRGSSAGP